MKRILWAAMMALVMLSLLAVPASAAKTVVCSVPGDFATIQAAIDAAKPGDTISVAAGTYEEQIDITKNLIIQGAGQNNTVIVSPTVLVAKFSNNKPIVTVRNGATATIKNLTVDGAGRGNVNYRFEGIAFYNAGGTVQNVTIIRVRNTPLSGAQHGVGLYANNTDGVARNLKVTNSIISDYQKNGMALSGIGLTVNVIGNTTTGSNLVPDIAQNGIQVSYGATGTVHSNTVTGNWYSGDSWASTGILIFESDGVSIQGNTVQNNQTGIGIETWSWILPSASNNKVINNTVIDAAWGITVVAYAWVYSTGNPVASNNKVVNNVITAVAGEGGIFVGADDTSDLYTATADNNKVITNDISGYVTPIDTELGTRSKVHANSFD